MRGEIPLPWRGDACLDEPIPSDPVRVYYRPIHTNLRQLAALLNTPAT